MIITNLSLKLCGKHTYFKIYDEVNDIEKEIFTVPTNMVSIYVMVLIVL